MCYSGASPFDETLYDGMNDYPRLKRVRLCLDDLALAYRLFRKRSRLLNLDKLLRIRSWDLEHHGRLIQLSSTSSCEALASSSSASSFLVPCLDHYCLVEWIEPRCQSGWTLQWDSSDIDIILWCVLCSDGRNTSLPSWHWGVLRFQELDELQKLHLILTSFHWVKVHLVWQLALAWGGSHERVSLGKSFTRAPRWTPNILTRS